VELGRAFEWTVARVPEARAIGGDSPLTYAEWDARVNRIAHALAGLGTERGSRVALALSNSETLASAHLAAQKLGALSTPLNIRYSADELAYCIEDCEPSVLLTDDLTVAGVSDALERVDGAGALPLVHDGGNPPSGAQLLDELTADAPTHSPRVKVTEDELSVMLYTSGTTGRPKGVPRSHRAEWSASVAHVVQARYGAGESTLGAMPMYHTMGIRSLLSMIVVGGTFVPLPAFDVEEAMRLIAAEEVTALYWVPTAFWTLARRPGAREACRSVKRLGYAGAAMTAALIERLEELIEPDVFINHYGCTELYSFTIADDTSSKPGSAGRPGIHSLMRVVTPDAERRVGPDAVVAAGEVGELIASLDSPEAFSGYWHRPDADAKALRDGWYFTGDLGYVDEDGDYWVAGRVDDMIITGGENVHPLEVEDALARSPDVADVAVVGLPHEKWGQQVTAFVVPQDDGDGSHQAAHIAAWIKAESGLSAYKRPRRVVVVAEIPKSPVGKVLRRKLVAGEYEALAETGDP
jgi:2-furoate---CoA ligase